MPSQITHALFVEEAYGRAFESDIENERKKWLVLGSSGPDPLYSSRQRKPDAEVWAYRIHDEGFGRLCAAMAGKVGDNKEMEAYLYGFCTHAVLDRAVHPLVNYFSGWVDPYNPGSSHLHFCHSYMERIIDMILLRDLRGTDLVSWRHGERIPSPEEAGRVLSGILAASINEAYPPEEAADKRTELAEAIRNAFLDNGDFFRMYNPSGPGVDRETAVGMERNGMLPERILALFYPDIIPPGDFLNEDGAGWLDPRTGEKRRESFMDLYTEAIREAGRILTICRAVLHDRDDPQHLEEALGNGDLDDPSPATGDNPLVYSEPMDISSLIDALYDGIYPSVAGMPMEP